MSDSDRSSVPDLASDSDDEGDFFPAGCNEECAKMWFDLSIRTREKHHNVIRHHVMGPFLFGIVNQPEHWISWINQAGLLPSGWENTLLDILSESQQKHVRIVQSALDVVLTNMTNDEILKELLDVIDFCERLKPTKIEGPTESLLCIIKKYKVLKKWSADIPGAHKKVGTAILFVVKQYTTHVVKLHKEGEDLVNSYNEDIRADEKKSEMTKEKGNVAYRDGNYKQAITLYKQAICRSPLNHVLYGNRAMAYLKTEDYAKALADGLRAVVLKPDWARGHYRYAEACFELGHVAKAIEANQRAQSMCSMTNDYKALVTQHKRFLEAPAKPVPSKAPPGGQKSAAGKGNGKTDSECKKAASDSTKPNGKGKPAVQTKEEEHNSDNDVPELVEGSNSESDDDEDDDYNYDEEFEDDDDCDPDDFFYTDEEKARYPFLMEKTDRDLFKLHQEEERKKEEARKQIKLMREREKKKLEEEKKRHLEEREQKRKEREEVRRRKKEQEEKRKRDKELSDAGLNPNLPESELNRRLKKRELSTNMKQGSESLLDSRSRNAMRHYQRALDLIKEENMMFFELEEIDFVVLRYALAIACVDTGVAKDICEGVRKLISIIEDHREVKFPLAHYGLGKAYFKQNRFKDAQKPLEKCLDIVEKNIVCGVHTWPGTQIIIEETRPGKLQVYVQQLLMDCHAPPPPDAVCRYGNCEGYFKMEIYFTDPDFKGFVRTTCFSECVIDFHPNCWKKIKSVGEERISDKDFTGRACLTPDCSATISTVRMYDIDGQKTKEFVATARPEEPKIKRKRTKMKPSSLSTIAARQARKETRKRHKQKQKEQEETQRLLDQLEEEEPQQQQQHNQQQGNTEEKDSPKEPLLDPAHLTVPNSFFTILKKEDKEDETKVNQKQSKAKQKKKKEKKVMSLGDFVGDLLEKEQEHQQYDEHPDRSYGIMDSSSPFVIPPHLRNNIDEFERSYTPKAGATKSEACSTLQDLEIKQNIFSYFADFFRVHGPMHVEDKRLLTELGDFPQETKNVISQHGGIGRLLIQSLQFAMVDNFICLMTDAVNAKTLADQYRKSHNSSTMSTPPKSNAWFPQNLSPSNFPPVSGAPPGLFGGNQDKVNSVSVTTNAKSPLSLGSIANKIIQGKNEGSYTTAKSDSGIGLDNWSAKSTDNSKVLFSDPPVVNRDKSYDNTSDKKAEDIREEFKKQVKYLAAPDKLKSDLLLLNAGEAASEEETASTTTSVPLLSSSDLINSTSANSFGFNSDLHNARMLEAQNNNNGKFTKKTAPIIDMQSDIFGTMKSEPSGGSAQYTWSTDNTGNGNSYSWSTSSPVPSKVGGDKELTGPVDFLLASDRDDVDSNDSRSSTSSPAHGVIKGPALSSSGSQYSFNPFVAKGFSPRIGESKSKGFVLDAAGSFSVGFGGGLGSSVWSPSAPSESDAAGAWSHSETDSSVSEIEDQVLKQVQQSDDDLVKEIAESVAKDLQEHIAFDSENLVENIAQDIRKDLSNASVGEDVKEDVEKDGGEKNSDSIPSVGFKVVPCTATRGCNTEPYQPYKAEYMHVDAERKALVLKLEQQQNAENLESLKWQERYQELKRSYLALEKRQKASAQEQEVERQRSLQERKALSDDVSTLKQHIKTIKSMEESANEKLKEGEKFLSEMRQQLQETQEKYVAEQARAQDRISDMEQKYTTALSRAESAEVDFLQLQQEVGSTIMEKGLHDAEHYCHKLAKTLKLQEEQGSLDPRLKEACLKWKDTLDKNRDIYAKSKKSFEEYITAVKRGTPLSSMPKLSIPRPSPPPELTAAPMSHPLALATGPPSSVSTTSTNNLPGGGATRPPLSLSGPPLLGAAISHPLENTRASPTTTSTTLSNLDPISVPRSVARPPGLPANFSATPLGGAISRPPGGALGVSGMQLQPNIPTVGGAAKNSFEKIVMTLLQMFPTMTRQDVRQHINDLRTSQGSLSGMKLEDIVRNVADNILDRTAALEAPTSQSTTRTRPPTSQPQGVSSSARTPAGFPMGSRSLGQFPGARPASSSHQARAAPPPSRPSGPSYTPDFLQMEEDPCVICHEELFSTNSVRLDCGHRFHDNCIRTWLREQRTCPTCRVHALMPDEFPSLGK